VTYRLLVDDNQSSFDVVQRAPAGLSSVTFKLTDKSGNRSKTFVDDVQVYLYGAGLLNNNRSALPLPESGTRGDALPLPPLPDGFRGGN
jgi:hypothetical protein